MHFACHTHFDRVNRARGGGLDPKSIVHAHNGRCHRTESKKIEKIESANEQINSGQLLPTFCGHAGSEREKNLRKDSQIYYMYHTHTYIPAFLVLRVLMAMKLGTPNNAKCQLSFGLAFGTFLTTVPRVFYEPDYQTVTTPRHENNNKTKKLHTNIEFKSYHKLDATLRQFPFRAS